MAASTLVIGYGNTLRGDDALGPAVVSLLAGRVDRAGVELIAAPMLTPEMAVAVADAELVVFIDAARDGPADRVICRRVGDRPAASSFGHQFDAAAVVDLARQMYGRAAESYLVTYRGRTFELREGLSPAVQAALEQVIARTLELISPISTATPSLG